MLNQANAVFQTMKEARDLRLRLNPIPPAGASQQTKMFAGLHFFASIFQYRLLEFIDHRTWQPFEDDLAILLREPEVAGWLSGAPSTTRLPSLEGFDPQFIEYLKSVHQRRVLGLVNR
jgi:hypothetical protein